MIVGDIGLTVCLKIKKLYHVFYRYFWNAILLKRYYNTYGKMITLYIALMYPIDWVFKKNVNQSIQNSLVFTILPGRIFSLWCWPILTTVLDRCKVDALSLPSVEKFLWMEDLELLLSKWKPCEFGLFNSKSSSSSSPSPAANDTCDLHSD